MIKSLDFICDLYTTKSFCKKVDAQFIYKKKKKRTSTLKNMIISSSSQTLFPTCFCCTDALASLIISSGKPKARSRAATFLSFLTDPVSSAALY